MNIDWIIIRRSVEGGLTVDEQTVLDKWLAESPTHRAFYEDVRSHYRHGQRIDIPEDKLQRYKADFELRLARRMVPGQHKPRRPWLRVAVVLLPLIAAGGLLWTLMQRQEAGSPVIEPGVIMAMVYNMDTGEQAVITVDRSDTTAQQSAQNIDNILPRGAAAGHRSDEAADQTWKVAIPRGAEYTLRIFDGTVVRLNSSSELTYNPDPDARERRIELKGEAYFDVSPDPQRPFIVTAEDVTVKVYGTRFNVNTRSSKYIDTVVEDGSVSVTADGEPEKMLRPGDMGQFDRSTGKIEIHQVDVNHYLSWQSGTYVFENRTIEDILSELSIWYNVDVEFPNPAAGSQRFSGSLPRNRELAQLLQLIEKTTRVHFEIDGRRVIVR